MKVAILGSGYVGVTTAAVAANAGHMVTLIDIDSSRIEVLKQGKSFFYEEGINPLIKTAVSNGSLVPTTKYSDIKDAGIVFSCVGTPDNPDGSSNLEFVFSAAKSAAKVMSAQSAFVQKSTVPVGTGSKVSTLLPSNVHYVSNPEFLREGSAVFDTLFFDRVVVGGNNIKSNEKVLQFYKEIEEHRDAIAKLAEVTSIADVGTYISTNLESAELIKVTANAFLALKISFANSIAKLADSSGADIVDVMSAVGADSRIGSAFFNAGRGYGGGCFPKDVSGLIASATEHAVDMPIMVAATDVNESMPGYIASRLKDVLGSLQDKNITVLGLAFKAGTSDARKSPGVKLANLLQKSNANIRVHDPHALDEATNDLAKDIKTSSSVKTGIQDADAVIFATDWDEYKDIPLDTLASNMRGDVIFDAMNMFDPSEFSESGLQYIGVGRK